MYSTQDFRNGLKIEYEGDPYIIVEFQHVKPGKGGAFVRTKIKNLLTGRVLDPTFKSGDKVGKPDMDEKEMQFLYKEGTHYTFMDNSNYEQALVDAEALGDNARWLKENCNCSVLFWNGKAIDVSLPNFVVLKIVECEPGVRGDTAQGATKPAKLETGTTVNVPLFVNEGDQIRIDTRTGSYVERA
ncbi:MAG: elongation factor P [Myxococcota bacterium]